MPPATVEDLPAHMAGEPARCQVDDRGGDIVRSTDLAERDGLQGASNAGGIGGELPGGRGEHPAGTDDIDAPARRQPADFILEARASP